jgi:hypothetical protein
VVINNRDGRRVHEAGFCLDAERDQKADQDWRRTLGAGRLCASHRRPRKVEKDLSDRFTADFIAQWRA